MLVTTKTKIATWVLLASFLLLFLSTTMTAQLNEEYGQYVGVILLVLIFGSQMYLWFFIKCPQCKKNYCFPEMPEVMLKWPIIFKHKEVFHCLLRWGEVVFTNKPIGCRYCDYIPHKNPENFSCIS